LSTKLTAPVVEFTEHTDGVEVEYVFAPAPAETVEVRVGGTASPAYVDTYDAPSMETVREVRVATLTVCAVGP
jgi:hypothetical protein